MPHQKITSKIETQIEKPVSKYLSSLKKQILLLEEGRLTFYYGGRPVRAQKSDIVRVISQTKPSTKIDLGVRNIILEAVMTAESLAVGSGFLTAKMIACSEKNNFTTTNRAEYSDILNVIENLTGLGLSSRIIKTIIKESSINSAITLSVSDMAFRPVVSTQPIFEMPGFLSELFFTQRKKISDCGVMFLDGVIETVGEIDCLLQSFSREKKSLVLFARGFSPEVSNTLNANYKSGKLYVFPVKVLGDENLFEDVSSHSNFYCLENYHSVRTLTCDDFDFVNNVEITNGKILIDGIESSKRKVHITLPNHFKSLLGVIEDRINFGKRLSIETANSGFGLESSSNLKYSLKSIKQSVKSFNSLKKSIDNLGAFVLQI